MCLGLAAKFRFTRCRLQNIVISIDERLQLWDSCRQLESDESQWAMTFGCFTDQRFNTGGTARRKEGEHIMFDTQDSVLSRYCDKDKSWKRRVLALLRAYHTEVPFWGGVPHFGIQIN